MNNNCCDLSMINGNSIDITPQGCDSEIKADIVVSEFNSVRLWGQVLNCHGEPVSSALLKLVKVVPDCNGKCILQGIAHSVSDCQGFYQFDLCVDDPCAKYKVLVNKSAVGTERIIENDGGNCHACSKPDYTPCGEYKYRITPPDHIDCEVGAIPTSPCSCGCNGSSRQKQYNKKSNGSCGYKQEPCSNYCMQETPCTSTHVGGNVYAPTKIRF